MTDSKTQAYAVRIDDHTLPAYHKTPRCRSFFFCLIAVATLLVPGDGRAAEPASLHVVVEGEIEAPFASVRATLLDLEALGGWFPSTEEWEVLDRDPESVLVYGRLVLPWPVDDRDYVARYSWRDTPGDFVLEARSVTGIGPAARDGVVRVEDMHTVWHIVPEGAATGVRYVYQGSPGGMLPDWVARVGWEMQTGILMDALAEEVERRRGSDAAPALAPAATSAEGSGSRPPR